jgi:uncharacterized protein YecE (DUF72 family)
MRPPAFIHGTSGWSYKDWVGLFYPPGTPEWKFLEFYATKFPGVEVDSTFYRTPSAKTADAWNKATPEGFLFSPKMVQEVTHEQFLEGAGDVAARFLDAIAPLGPKLGPVVLQFPYFKKDEGVALDVFLGRLGPFLEAMPKGPSFAVEVRNKTFLEPALLDALRDRGAALVLNDHPWMPRPEEWLALPGVFTAPSVPIRLLGDRYAIEKITDRRSRDQAAPSGPGSSALGSRFARSAEGWARSRGGAPRRGGAGSGCVKTWGETVLDKGKVLEAWAKVVRAALASGHSVTAFANNHFAGYAPKSAEGLAEAVREAGSTVSGNGLTREEPPE